MTITVRLTDGKTITYTGFSSKFERAWALGFFGILPEKATSSDVGASATAAKTRRFEKSFAEVHGYEPKKV